MHIYNYTNTYTPGICIIYYIYNHIYICAFPFTATKASCTKAPIQATTRKWAPASSEGS